LIKLNITKAVMAKKKILIIDNFEGKKHPSQENIYKYLEERFDCRRISRLYKFLSVPFLKMYDIVYFGINHDKVHREGMESIFRMDLNQVLAKMRKKQILIVDQVDNESFLEKNTGKYRIDYNKYFNGKKILLDRYSTRELKIFADKNNFILEILPLTIVSDEYKNIDFSHKDIDITFICDSSGDSEFRNKELKVLENIVLMEKERTDLKFFISSPQYYPKNILNGNDYKNILKRSKILIAAESDRPCMTPTYLETALSGCYLAGDKPLYSENKILNNFMSEIDLTNFESMVSELNSVLERYKSLENTFQKCMFELRKNYDSEIVMNKFVFNIFRKDLKI